MPEHTFHVDLPRDLTTDEELVMVAALEAAWETIATRSDRWARLSPHPHHLAARVQGLHDAHADDDGHETPKVNPDTGKERKHKPHDDLIGLPVHDVEDDDSRAQLYCGDCGRARQGDAASGALVCASIADHPGRAVACHPKCAVDCGVQASR